MTKIMPEHLTRLACVYIRQSTADQLLHNQESQRRQYGLADRARALGWSSVEVIDDDLGRSGGGSSRPGFERLLSAICEGRVGAVFAIEASRLARNGRDWHTLIEFCGLVGAIIVDEDGVYDPRLPNDRLLLGMKGTMSELELSMFRQRSHEALKQKARRGELFLRVASGYVKAGKDRIEKDPDQRVQEALALVFAKFSEFRSVRQVLIWLVEEGIKLPVKARNPEAQGVVWRTPAYNTVHNILTNPIYAGAYVFGRTGSRVSVEAGRKRVRRGLRRAPQEWDVLLRERHEGYISWDEFERNQRVIADNANRMGIGAVKGAVRRGELLLAGLLRCGHCGRKLHVFYSGDNGRYQCYGARTNHGGPRCISIAGAGADRAVAAEVLRVLKPIGVDAAVKAVNALMQKTSAAQRQLELALQKATFDVAHARRQYDAVDPANRLVAGELERRWNAALEAKQKIESDIAALLAERPAPLGAEEQEALRRLGGDLQTAWAHPAATASMKKRILRAAIHEIIVRKEDGGIGFVMHWQGGAHTALQLKVRITEAGHYRWNDGVDLVAQISQLARIIPDRQIARLLKRGGVVTGHGNGWSEPRVRSFRNHHEIEVFREGELAERGEITLLEAAQRLDVAPMTVHRMVTLGRLQAKQVCRGAPWVLKAADVAEFAKNGGGNRPPPSNAAQQSFDFQ
jgi:DNA invertase Pin-like site-specific DNA recombinase